MVQNSAIADNAQAIISLDMLILFGSYARGDWVEDLDPDTLQYRYQSDYDLMVVTETRKQAMAFEQNSALISKLNKTIHRTPISLIAEDIKFVNKRLRKSQFRHRMILIIGLIVQTNF